MAKEFQFDLLKSKEENLKRAELFDSNALPTNVMQEKLATENPELTDREFSIMQMVLSGLSIEDIAIKIYLSRAGVKWRLSSVYHKFGVANRLELIKKSAKEGLQFISETGVKHVFHNKIDLRAFEEKFKGSSDE